MKLPSFCRNSGSRRKWRRWGAPPDGGKVCFSGGWECPSAAARALPGRGGALWGCFSERAAAGRCAGPAVRGDAAREPAQEAAAGCVFQWEAERSTAGAVWAAEGSGGEVNAVGTAVRALVEAPVGFEKALEGIGCGAGDVGRGGGVGGEHVGRGAGGDGRRESGGGEHRAERGDRGEEKRRSGAAASARGAAGEGGGGRCGRVGGAGAGSEEQQQEHHGQGVEVEGLAVAQLDGNHRGAIEAEGAGLEIGREQRGRGAVAGRRVGLTVDGRGGIDGGRRRGGRRGVRVLVGREEALTEAAPEVEAEADDEGEFEEVEHEHEGFAEQVVELLEEVEHGVWSDEGVKRGGIGGFAVGPSGLVALPGGLRGAASAVGRCLAGVGGRGLRVGLRWPPCGFVLMVQRSDFVRKKMVFSESCTTKRRRTAMGCCKLMDASRGPLQVCSPMPCDPAPTGVQGLGQAALRSPLCPCSHAPSPTTCGDGSGSEGELLRGGLQ